MRRWSAFGAPPGGGADGGDGPPLVPILVPDSGAFSPSSPAPPARSIRLPSSAELRARIIEMSRAGASARDVFPYQLKLQRAEAREAALRVPGLPGVGPGTVLRDDAGRPLPGGAVQPPVVQPPVVQPPVVQPPVVQPPVVQPPVVQPPVARDVTERVAASAGKRLLRDLVTFAVLTSPAWVLILLSPRRKIT